MVREALAAADRVRRGRAASRTIWKAAPAVAGAALLAAAAAFLARLPAAVPLGVLAAGLCALAGYALISRRRRPVSDAAAAAIDAQAGLGGQLRSAAWFAARPSRDEWADFHVERAAAALERLDWKGLFPRAPARGAQAVTSVLTLAAVALSLTIPERAGGGSGVSAAAGDRQAQAEARRGPMLLTPELQAQLAALLAAADEGDAARAEAVANSTELRDMLNQLNRMGDQELLDALARAMAAADSPALSAAGDRAALAERARRAAEMASLPLGMKDALQKLAEELDAGSTADSQAAGADGAADGGTPPGQPGGAAAAGASQDLSIQFAKDAEASSGAGMLMMSAPDGQQGSGPPGAGVGGGAGSEPAAGAAAGIEAALKQEIVEANQDDAGANVQTEIRRKTEHGNATVAFTSSGAAEFDRSRAAAPPPVPEARRSDVQSYFIRKP